MTKIPGGKPPEKTEPLLSDGQDVVANTADEPLHPVMFLNDHQLPLSDEPPPAESNPDRWKGKLQGAQSPNVSKRFGGF